MSIAQAMDDKAQLNPSYVRYIIQRYILSELQDLPIQEFTYNYTFKIDDDLHKSIKLKTIEKGLPMNEFVGRIFSQYY